MKKSYRFYTLFLLGIFTISCAWARSFLPGNSAASDVADWDAWNFSWKTAATYPNVTVTWGQEQKTYTPEAPNDLFLAVQAEIVNTSFQTQDIRLSKDTFYVTDKEQNTYELVGLVRSDSILMGPPYNLIRPEDTLLTAEKWNDGGFVTVAYQPGPAIWFIEATPGKEFFVAFLFAVPADAYGLVLHDGNGNFISAQP